MSLCLINILRVSAFDDVREVHTEIMEIWRDMVFSADHEDDAMKSLAAFLWETFPEESPDDVKLKKMLANAFKSTFHILPSNVELQVPRLLAMQNMSNEAQNTLKNQVQTCNEQSAKQKLNLDKIQEESKLTSGNVDQLSQAMRTYHETKDNVDRLHTAHKNVFKRKGSVEEQRTTALDLKKAWTEHEGAVESLNKTFKLLNIQNGISIDDRFKRTMSSIFDLYEKYYEPGSE